jgi:hypothetical protein
MVALPGNEDLLIVIDPEGTSSCGSYTLSSVRAPRDVPGTVREPAHLLDRITIPSPASTASSPGTVATGGT